MSLFGPLIHELNSHRFKTARRNRLYVSFANGVSNRKSVNRLSFHLFSVRANWRGSKARKLGCRELSVNSLPTVRCVMMTFIEENEVEVVRRKLCKPLLAACRNDLLNV